MGSSLRFKYLSFCIDGTYEYEKLWCKRDLALAEILMVVVVVRVEDAYSFFNTCTCNATQQRVSRVGHGLGKEIWSRFDPGSSRARGIHVTARHHYTHSFGEGR